MLWGRAGGWTRAALRAECHRRGVLPDGMPQSLFDAAQWTAHVIASEGDVSECCLCGKESATQLWCVACSLSFCHSCLKVRDGQLWDLLFECAGCSIESLCHVDGLSSHEEWLLGLSTSWIRTRSHSLKPDSWDQYQRCMRSVIQFMRDYGVVIFPVLDESCAKGLCLFFQHLKSQGVSGTRMATFRSALTNASRAAGLRNPWKKFPRLEELSAGLSRELTTPTSRREGVTILMVKRLVSHLEVKYRRHAANGDTRRACTALCNLVAICLGFFSMRRGSELWLNKSSHMGLRRSRVELVRGSHVILFIQSMKNDTDAKGTEVVIAWVTASGIPVGEFVLLLQAHLQASGVPWHGPLFCATGPRRTDGFVTPARFGGILGKYLPRLFEEFRKRFSWHSLRRGGATWAHRMRVDMRLIMGHGAWRSEAGVLPYLSADLMGKFSVTLAM